jgi:hypothetical protein
MDDAGQEKRIVELGKKEQEQEQEQEGRQSQSPPCPGLVLAGVGIAIRRRRVEVKEKEKEQAKEKEKEKEQEKRWTIKFVVEQHDLRRRDLRQGHADEGHQEDDQAAAPPAGTYTLRWGQHQQELEAGTPFVAQPLTNFVKSLEKGAPVVRPRLVAPDGPASGPAGVPRAAGRARASSAWWQNAFSYKRGFVDRGAACPLLPLLPPHPRPVAETQRLEAEIEKELHEAGGGRGQDPEVVGRPHL